MTHLITSNMAFVAFPGDGARRHRHSKHILVSLPLYPWGPTFSTSAAHRLPVCYDRTSAHYLRAHVCAWSVRRVEWRRYAPLLLITPSGLMLRLLGHVPWASADECDLGMEEVDEGGKARRPLGWAVKRTFGEKGIEYILYNIYMPYLTTPTSCLHRNIQGPSHPDPKLPCNIEETWSEGTVQCALQTAAKMPLKCIWLAVIWKATFKTLH